MLNKYYSNLFKLLKTLKIDKKKEKKLKKLRFCDPLIIRIRFPKTRENKKTRDFQKHLKPRVITSLFKNT